jgi:hypothetical protein
VRHHGEYEFQDPKSEDEVVNVVFINKDRKHIPIRGKIGDNLMYLGHRYGVEIEGYLKFIYISFDIVLNEI